MLGIFVLFHEKTFPRNTAGNIDCTWLGFNVVPFKVAIHKKARSVDKTDAGETSHLEIPDMYSLIWIILPSRGEINSILRTSSTK